MENENENPQTRAWHILQNRATTDVGGGIGGGRQPHFDAQVRLRVINDCFKVKNEP